MSTFIFYINLFNILYIVFFLYMFHVYAVLICLCESLFFIYIVRDQLNNRIP